MYVEQNIQPSDNLDENLRYFDVDYVVLLTDSISDEKSVEGLEIVGVCDNYSIYRLQQRNEGEIQ